MTADVDYWGRARWILEALPPGRFRRIDASTRSLLRAKLREYTLLTVQPQESERPIAVEQVSPGVQIGLALAWWSGRMAGVEAPVPEAVVSAIAASLTRHAGGVANAHALMMRIAAARAASHDRAFTESAIRIQRLERLKNRTD